MRIVGGTVPTRTAGCGEWRPLPGTRVTAASSSSASGGRKSGAREQRIEKGEEKERNGQRAFARENSRRRSAPFDEHVQAAARCLHAWARLLPVTIRRGEKYLDFLGGIAVNALGYAHPRLVRVIRREAGRAIHVSNLFHNPYQGPLAEKLAKWSGMDRVFFTNSGTEAMEGALKLARAYARKKAGGARPRRAFWRWKIPFMGARLARFRSRIRRNTASRLSRWCPGVEFVRLNDVADLEAKFDATVCAIVIEPIQGEGGIYPVSDEFWKRARELATQHGAALIADEIQCGLGRTGRAFRLPAFDSRLPDIVMVAKPLAGGLPLGAFLASEEFAAAFSPGLHGSTFGGGPLICATALEVPGNRRRGKAAGQRSRARRGNCVPGLKKLRREI